jgi:hypothetical protein
MMWTLAEYEASALFTLKPASATTSGGKTLLVPTPFAIKMALLDTACRLVGQDAASAAWDSWLRGALVALRPAHAVVVNNTFTKVLKPRRNPAEPGSQHAGFFMKSIAYREYAYLDGSFGIAIETPDVETAAQAQRWFAGVNYLGKRGSFIQLQAIPIIIEDLPPDYLQIDGDLGVFGLDTLLTQLDDAGEGADFERVNIYSGKPLRLGRERVLRHVALSYRLVSSSRGYSYYEWSEP